MLEKEKGMCCLYVCLLVCILDYLNARNFVSIVLVVGVL